MTHLDRVQPDDQSLIVYTIHSDEPDCTVPVVFHDVNNNDQLDVTEQGQPVEHWNYTERCGKATTRRWRSLQMAASSWSTPAPGMRSDS